LYPMNKSVTAYRQANKIEGMKSSVLTGRPPTNVGLFMVAVVMVVQTQEREGQSSKSDCAYLTIRLRPGVRSAISAIAYHSILGEKYVPSHM